MSKQQADPSKTEPKTVKFEDTLKCVLTDDELQQKGAQLADAIDEVTRLEADLASIKTQFKAKIDGATAKANGLASTIRSKAEYRAVKCERVFDFKGGLVREFRLDTSEQTNVRQMTNDDRQQHLPLEERTVEAAGKPDTGATVTPFPKTGKGAATSAERAEVAELDDKRLLDDAELVKPDSDFVASVRSWFDEHGSITPAQREALENIINE